MTTIEVIRDYTIEATSVREICPKRAVVMSAFVTGVAILLIITILLYSIHTINTTTTASLMFDVVFALVFLIGGSIVIIESDKYVTKYIKNKYSVCGVKLTLERRSMNNVGTGCTCGYLQVMSTEYAFTNNPVVDAREISIIIKRYSDYITTLYDEQAKEDAKKHQAIKTCKDRLTERLELVRK